MDDYTRQLYTRGVARISAGGAPNLPVGDTQVHCQEFITHLVYEITVSTEKGMDAAVSRSRVTNTCAVW